jgi:2-polyprenyl-6-methoxyphenol hydroxylase-like FAD-dependent oxidoreductase
MQRTQVAIIGGGPAGLLLSHMLHLDGIENVVIERQSKSHVLERIRAGVLEDGTVLAVSDVYYLHRGFEAHFKRGHDCYLEAYSATALRRVWGAERLSWWLTKLLHVFPDQDGFATRCNQNEFDHLCGSKAAQAALAEQYVGLLFDA